MRCSSGATFTEVKISVLIPTYNSERHLAECLDSVLQQDFADMEILIADDGSTDGTPAVIQAYAARDPRIRCWRNPANLGLVANHNLCLRQARGEYVKFVHADDKLLSAVALRKMAAALDAHPSAILAGCRQHLTGTDARPVCFFHRSGIYAGRKIIVACLEQNVNLLGQPTLTLFRRSVARRGFDTRFVGHLDYEMWCHLLEQGDFYYLAEPLATWRVHADQQTARHQTSGQARHEHLTFVETYYAKPWLRQAATRQMLFTQIYYLQKKYGEQAQPLTAAMRQQLSGGAFVWQWAKHKIARPFQKLCWRWFYAGGLVGGAICSEA